MEIKPLTVEDVGPLSKLYYQFWNEESDVEKMKRKFVDLQNNPTYILLGAVEDRQLAGSVMGIVCEELYGECKPFLVVENMIVDNQYRKKGVGRLLFRELEKHARCRGCTQIILVTEGTRKDACSFYESIGFHPTNNKGYKKKLN